MARMWAASLLSLKNPEGNRSFHAHLFALSGAALEAAVTVEKLRRQARLTHPLERQESHNLGLLLLQSGNRSEGIEHVRKAVEIFPRSLNAHLNLGNVALNDRRYGDAIDEYNTALSISPGSRSIEQRLELARRGAQQ